jgi:glycosyltransferase involved in cell wall biosynthesis
MVDGVRRHGAREVHVLPGIVVEAACPQEVRRAIRSDLGVMESECLFVYVGALGVANGLDVLLDAARGLEDESLTIVVAGDGSDRARLERRLAELRLEHLRLLGPVPRRRAGELLCAADVCLHVLRPDPLFEGVLPTKILEAFGAHRPVITTVPGVSRDLAEQSGGAFAGSADALRAELRRWSGMNPEERQRRGEQAFAYGSECFAPEKIVDELERLLERVAG